MNQFTRPEQINTILKWLNTQFPYNMRVPLEAYISDLEANQKAVQLDNPPNGSQQRAEERRQNRYRRATLKQTGS